MKYASVLRAFYGATWAMRRDALGALAEIVAYRTGGGVYSADEMASRLAARRETPRPTVAGGVAVIPLYGMIMPRANLISDQSGLVTAESFGRSVSAAADDDSITRIVLDIDSPGGYAAGIPEAAAAVSRAAARKPVTAVANLEAASAAYWIATQASELVVSPSGEVGSVGVYQIHTDVSQALSEAGVKHTLIYQGQHKVEGNPYEPLGDEARAYIQSRVDHDYATFIHAVAAGRRTSIRQVIDTYGEGRMIDAADAVRRGMADRVATLDEVLAAYGLATNNSPSDSRRRGSALETAMRRQRQREIEVDAPRPGA